MPKPVHNLIVPASFEGKIAEGLRAGTWYERDMLDYIRSLKIGGYYVDCGANLGNHSAYFATQTEAVHVFAIEPSPHNIQKCTEFLAVNGLLEKVSLLPIAGASHKGIIEFDLQINLHDTWRIRAYASCLDDILPMGIGLMKIDVEGAEVDLLQGCSRILTKDRPRLFVEALSSAELKAIKRIIEPYGYRETGRVFNPSPTYEFVADQ